MQKNSIIITIIVALLVGAAAFYGGMQFQTRQRTDFVGRQFITTGSNGQQFQRRGNFQGARPINGEIINQDDNSITVKMQDGSTKIVILSDQTTINKSSAGTKSDLKTGERVTAFGTENFVGSITAQNITLNPEFRGGLGGQGLSPSPSP